MKGGVVWFVAGIFVCALVLNDGSDGAIELVIGAVGAIAAFIGALGLGPAAILVLIVGAVMGVQWSERTRGRQEADAAWQKRNSYRK